MIEISRWIRICLFLALGWLPLSVSTPAQADQHVVSGCLAMVDTRGDDAPPGRGGNNAVDEVEVKLHFTDLAGVEHQAIAVPGSGTLKTEEDGCFAALLTLVPEVTTVRPEFVLDEDDRKVRRISATWRLALSTYNAQTSE